MNGSNDAIHDAYIALVGTPNCGKTTLFNALTGSRQKVANYPGVTVERKEGILATPNGSKYKVLDLPGVYSLNPSTQDQKVTHDVLVGESIGDSKPSFLLVVADATHLERGLGLILELKSLKIPMVLAINMIDLARKGKVEIDSALLAKELDVFVFPVSASKREGMNELIQSIEDNFSKHQTFHDNRLSLSEKDFSGNSPQQIRFRLQEVDRILHKVRKDQGQPFQWTDRIDRIVLHPLWGTLLLVAVLFFVFQSVFNWASYPMDWIEQGIGYITQFLQSILPSGVFKNFLIDGVIAGVGSVLVFLPQILLIFFFILLLEDSGYMARAAFLMDQHMKRAGLHGRAFIPLLSSFACAIPGIMATRTIDRPRDRLITILIAPLMTCSARLPVYTLLISAFVPNQVIWGPIRLQGVVMFGLYLLGVVSALLVAWILKKTLLRGPVSHFMLEMPTYKWPNFRSIVIGMLERGKIFLRRAGTTIMVVAMLIWFFSSYPKPPQNITAQENPIRYSFAGRIGHAIEPAIRPLGFDWSIGFGLLTAMAAREVMVSSLATVYSVENQNGDSTLKLSEIIQQRWGVATGLSLLIYFVFAMQCFSTLAVARRETNSLKWPMVMFGYMTALAYGASFITYRLAVYFTA